MSRIFIPHLLLLFYTLRLLKAKSPSPGSFYFSLKFSKNKAILKIDKYKIIKMWLLVIIVIFILYAVIVNFIENEKQREKDRAAREVLKDFNYQRERQKIFNISRALILKINRCPMCGGVLLIRTGIYGKFFGCSNYPSCRYTKKAKHT